MQKKLQLSLVSVALVSSLHAQNAYNLESISVSASQGTILEKKDVTDSVTVITKEAIEESRVTTLNEALSKLGGISMTQNGGAGKNASMFMRGMSSKRILVLIDGVRYNNPTSVSGAEFSQIMLYNVEQIEIIKGSQSGVWGSEASAGVINIITSKAKKGFHSAFNAEYGSFNTKKSSLQLSYATDSFDILLNGFMQDTDGISAVEAKKSEAEYGKRYDELGLEKDAYTNKSLDAKIGYNISDDDRIQVSVQATNSLNHYDGGAGITKDNALPNQYLQNRFYNLSYGHKDSLNDLKINYSSSTFKRKIVGTYGNSQYIGSVNEVKIDDKISYMEDSFLRVGASYQEFEQEDVTTDTDKSYSAISAFATNYNKLSTKTIITESIRYDRFDEFDNSLTAKFGAKQFVHNDIFVSTNIGTGYNAPTLGQLYGQYGPNPDLKPEKSLTSELSIGNDTLWVTGFYNEIKDLIEYDWTDGYMQASGKSKFKGLELGYEDFLFDSLGVNATYTYLKTEDSKGEELDRRPKHQLDTNIVYYVNDSLDIGLRGQYIGKRIQYIYGTYNVDAQTGKYVTADFTTNYKYNENFSFYGKINNLSDKYYQSVDGYATAGRSFYLGFNAKY